MKEKEKEKIIIKEKNTTIIDVKLILKRIWKFTKIILILGVISLALILLMNMIAWFRINTIQFHSPIEVKFYKPVEIKTLEQVKSEELQRMQQLKYETDKQEWFDKKDEILNQIKSLEASAEAKAFKNVDKIASITAYTCDPNMTPKQKAINCPNGLTATGKKPVAGVTIACDKANLGKTFEIQGYGERVCQDVGGAIKGAGVFDLYVDTLSEALNFGTQNIKYKLVK